MFKSDIILENLRENDLIYLVSDTILIDEFESKFSSDNYVVVAFMLKNNEALKDLRNFIQITCINEIFLVDDMEFYDYDYDSYLLFVEFERNLYFPQNLLKVLEKVSYLCGISKWKMKIHNIEKIFSVNELNLKKFISYTLINKNKGKQLKECLNLIGIDYKSPYTRYFSYNTDVYKILAAGTKSDINYYFSDFFEDNKREITEATVFAVNPNIIKSDNFLILKTTDTYPIVLLSKKEKD